MAIPTTVPEAPEEHEPARRRAEALPSRIRERKQRTESRLSAEAILEHRDADRR